MLDAQTIARALRATPGSVPFPSSAAHAHWQAARATTLGQQVLALADEALQHPTPALPASGYLAFQRTGARYPFEDQVNARRTRVMLFALAECLEGTGRLLDAVLDEAWAICEESSWVIPAHGWDYPDGLPLSTQPSIDLIAAITAFTLAEVDYLLADRLHSALRARIRSEVRRRTTAAFLARDDYRWLRNGVVKANSPNWAAVCAAGVAGATLYLEDDLDIVAAVLAKSLATLERYLQTFPDDGACAEGVGYWEKGIFFYAALGELLERRTDGAIDLFARPEVRRIAAFPHRALLSPGYYVPFSDIPATRQPQRALLHFLARRYGLPELAALDSAAPPQRVLTDRGPAERLRDLFWYPQAFMPTVPTPPTHFFPAVQWLIARAEPVNPDGLVLAAKGGHNDEPHNHNDVGSFVVHWRGESLIAELGAGVYSREYFCAETRYSYLTTSSLGHSVPVVNGYAQAAGASYRAQGVRYHVGASVDRFLLDLTAAYPLEADLAHLQRTLTLCRAPKHACIELADQATFRDAPGQLQSVLISFAVAQPIEQGCLVVRGERGALLVQYDHELLTLEIERIDDLPLKRQTTSPQLTRLTFRPLQERMMHVQIALRLTPVA